LQQQQMGMYAAPRGPPPPVPSQQQPQQQQQQGFGGMGYNMGGYR
jgi:hypothetical protein